MSQIQLSTKWDSFMGKIVFRWNKQTFKQVIQHFNFDPKGNDKSALFKKFKIPQTQRWCTVVIYGSGTVLLNGCQGEEEMENVINQFLNKMPKQLYNKIGLGEPFKINNCRYVINIGKQIDIQKIHQNIYGNSSYLSMQIENMNSSLNKIIIPDDLHRYKDVKMIVTNTAHLISNLSSFIRKFSLYLLTYFAKKQNISEGYNNIYNFDQNKHKKIKKQTNLAKNINRKNNRQDIQSINDEQLNDEIYNNIQIESQIEQPQQE